MLATEVALRACSCEKRKDAQGVLRGGFDEAGLVVCW